MAETPSVDELPHVVAALRAWQHDAARVPLHPGDIGWLWRLGPDVTARALRTWSDRGRLRAVGMLDGPDVLRLAIAPDAMGDEQLARRIADDLADADSGVLPTGKAQVEARWDGALPTLLRAEGWHDDEPWTPLQRDLSAPVEDGDPHLRIVVVGAAEAEVRCAVHRAAFARSTFTPERWRAMAAGTPYADARCLVAYAGADAVAALTVWSAGAGRPGLLEPVGVHPDHRGRGHGRAISVAAAAALRELGASSATVCTPRSNTAAVATYGAAGFVAAPDVPDLARAG